MNIQSALFLLFLLTSLACRAEAPAGTVSCAACHGDTGIATQAGVPHLNGQLRNFLADSMKAFVNQTRPTAVAQHKAFQSTEIDAMADYFAGQKGVRPRGAGDPARIARGEQVYQRRCADCHLDGGRGSDKDAPLLAAQNSEFLATQTLMFKSGLRKFPFMMDDSYRGLADDELAAVAEYFAAQDQFPPAEERRKRRRP